MCVCVETVDQAAGEADTVPNALSPSCTRAHAPVASFPFVKIELMISADCQLGRQMVPAAVANTPLSNSAAPGGESAAKPYVVFRILIQATSTVTSDYIPVGVSLRAAFQGKQRGERVRLKPYM